MLDPNALGTAFDIHWQLVHSVTFIEQYSGPQGRRRCLAAGVLDIWHSTDPADIGTARTARDVPALENYYYWVGLFLSVPYCDFSMSLATKMYV